MNDESGTQKVHQLVRDRYGRIARERDGAASCCSASSSSSTRLGYSAEDLATLPPGADMGLGSGHPVAEAALQQGEVVLDLGSGGGIDCIFAARQVGSGGRVIGVDMTEAMLQTAREAARQAGLANVEFRLGQIEVLPVEEASVDVVISNCVVNLSPDKPAVWREVARVLKPGGRVVVSDIVASAPLPAALREKPELLCGCVSGAASMNEIRQQLAEAGLKEVRIEPREASYRSIRKWLPEATADVQVVSAMIHARKPV